MKERNRLGGIGWEGNYCTIFCFGNCILLGIFFDIHGSELIFGSTRGDVSFVLRSRTMFGVAGLDGWQAVWVDEIPLFPYLASVRAFISNLEIL